MTIKSRNMSRIYDITGEDHVQVIADYEVPEDCPLLSTAHESLVPGVTISANRSGSVFLSWKEAAELAAVLKMELVSRGVHL